MIQEVSKVIDEYQLAGKGETILVALSGGPDSVVLLHLLSRLQKRNRWKLTALYINHNLRPKEAKREESFCKRYCEKLSIDCIIERADVPSIANEQKTGLEEAARNIRYAIFNRVADRIGAQRIATGHHADDQAETVLFRIIRGTGLTGLTGIPRKRDRIVRPLLDFHKDEIMAYIEREELSYCLDSSNKELSIRRNLLRHKLLPMIRKDINPRVETALTNLAELVSQEESYLNSVVQKATRKVVRKRVSGKVELHLVGYRQMEKWLRWRVLRSCVAKASGSLTVPAPDRSVIERLDRFCFSEKRSLSLPMSLQATIVEQTLFFHKTKTYPFSYSLIPGQVVDIESLGLSLQVQQLRQRPSSVKIRRRANRVLVDFDRLVLPLEVRTIRRGDRFVPLGMKGHKKVGDYLTDRKVTPVLRDEIPVVADRQGIVWLVGYEIDDRVKIDRATRKVLRIGCTKRRRSKSQTV